jgi:hypothetical protein
LFAVLPKTNHWTFASIHPKKFQSYANTITGINDISPYCSNECRNYFFDACHLNGQNGLMPRKIPMVGKFDEPPDGTRLGAFYPGAAPCVLT